MVLSEQSHYALKVQFKFMINNNYTAAKAMSDSISAMENSNMISTATANDAVCNDEVVINKENSMDKEDTKSAGVSHPAANMANLGNNIDNRDESVVDGFINQIEKANTVYSFDDCLSLIEWTRDEVCADLLRQLKDWLENERPDLLRFVGMSYSDISEEWDGAPIYMGNLPLLALKNRFYIGEKCYNIGDALELNSFDIFEMMESLDDNYGHWDWVPDVVGGFFRSVA